jgi:hypothetical protein
MHRRAPRPPRRREPRDGAKTVDHLQICDASRIVTNAKTVSPLNAARVPRHFERAGITVRHHVALALDGAQCTARERLVTAEGP